MLTYDCSRCHKEFATAGLYRAHTCRSSSSSSFWTCGACGLKFTTSETLLKHSCVGRDGYSPTSVAPVPVLPPVALPQRLSSRLRAVSRNGVGHSGVPHDLPLRFRIPSTYASWDPYAAALGAEGASLEVVAPQSSSPVTSFPTPAGVVTTQNDNKFYSKHYKALERN